MGPGGNALVLYEDVPFYWDAWDIMPYALDKVGREGLEGQGLGQVRG